MAHRQKLASRTRNRYHNVHLLKHSYAEESTSLALTRKVRLVLKRLFLIGAIVCILGGSVGGYWLWRSNYYQSLMYQPYSWLMQQTIKWGFAITGIYVKGQENTQSDEINQVVEPYKERSIWEVDLTQVKSDLEQLEWVKNAAIERKLPGTLVITLQERQPIAIWQHAGQLYLIDTQGNVIDKPGDVAKYSKLILIVGQDIPAYMDELFTLFPPDSELYKQITTIIRVGERRWNIRLYNGIEILLPENNPEQALMHLTTLHAKTKILNQAIDTIDLRLSDKISIH